MQVSTVRSKNVPTRGARLLIKTRNFSKHFLTFLNFKIMKIYLKKDTKYNQLCFKAVKELPMNIKQAWYTRNKFFSFLIEDYGMYICLTIYK